MQGIGKLLVIAGIILVVLGVIIYFAGNKLQWFGNLPGDIRIKRENFSFYMPITSMLLLSIVLSVLWWLVRKNFG